MKSLDFDVVVRGKRRSRRLEILILQLRQLNHRGTGSQWRFRCCHGRSLPERSCLSFCAKLRKDRATDNRAGAEAGMVKRVNFRVFWAYPKLWYLFGLGLFSGLLFLLSCFCQRLAVDALKYSQIGIEFDFETSRSHVETPLFVVGGRSASGRSTLTPALASAILGY